MGLIKAIAGTVGGALGDTWLEAIEPENMTKSTCCTPGVLLRKGVRSSNTKGTADVISNKSVIHVYDNQMMILVDGGKIIDYTAEPGYFQVDNSSMPSLMNGSFGDSLKEAFNRFKFGGGTPQKQVVYYINLQELTGIRFGTPAPIQYFDSFYNSELFLRANGTFSIKITNPLLFYAEVVSRDNPQVEIDNIIEQYRDEFLQAFSAALNQYSVDGLRVSSITSKSVELGKYMRDVLDADWKEMRGFEVQSVGVRSISYDDDSKKLIQMRNQGAMLSDPTVREGYVQGAVARGMEAAGSNTNGAMNAFMGMGMGSMAGGGMLGGFSANNAAQAQQQQAAAQQQQAAAQQAQAAAQPANNGWTCECGHAGNTGKFCAECGKPKPAPAPAANEWTCSCGVVNTGKFCAECGAKRPEANGPWTCECGQENTGKFCANCGKPRP